MLLHQYKENSVWGLFLVSVIPTVVIPHRCIYLHAYKMAPFESIRCGLVGKSVLLQVIFEDSKIQARPGISILLHLADLEVELSAIMSACVQPCSPT